MSQSPIQRVAQATPEPMARRIRGLSDRTIAWIFVAPTIFLLLAVNIFPLIWTVRLSFTDFRVNRPNRDVEWVGLENYQRILTDQVIKILRPVFPRQNAVRGLFLLRKI